jgi:hypothetical protein
MLKIYFNDLYLYFYIRARREVLSQKCTDLLCKFNISHLQLLSIKNSQSMINLKLPTNHHFNDLKFIEKKKKTLGQKKHWS